LPPLRSPATTRFVVSSRSASTPVSRRWQAPNQPRFEIFAEKETTFFLKVVDAQIDFEVDPAGGRATGLVLHQAGQSISGKRIE
jgi:hypothetical protein